MQPWQQFFEMVGGAAATLLGLLFVSVSLNADLILSGAHPHSRRLAEQAFQNYLAIIVVALFAMLPDMPVKPLGWTLFSICAIWTGWAAVRFVQTARGTRGRDAAARGTMRRYFTSLFGFALLMVAAYRMVTGGGTYVDYIASGTVILLISATLVSWELLVKIAEEKYRSHRD